MAETGKSPGGEELAALQDELAVTRAEVERLQERAVDAEARAAAALGEAAAMEAELATAREGQAAASGEAQASREYLRAAEERLRHAAEKYRDLVIRSEPELPAELIAGEDVDAVDASASSARSIVEQVRARLPEAAREFPVPAGAPPRGAPDYSGLSPEQKIRIGLERRAS